jgi:HSP20 family protein
MISNLSVYRVPSAVRATEPRPRRSPFGPSLFDLDRFFANLQNQPARSLAPPETRGFTPRVVVEESAAEFRVVAELPGVEAEAIDVSVEEDVLMLKGSRKLAFGAPAGEQTESAEAAETAGDDVTNGADSSSFERSIRFGPDIDAAQVRASYKNGVLVVTVPKRVAPEPQVVHVPVD